MLTEDDLLSLNESLVEADKPDDFETAMDLLQQTREMFLELLVKDNKKHFGRKFWKLATSLEVDVEVFLEQFEDRE